MPRLFANPEDALRATLRSPPAAIVAEWSTPGLCVASLSQEIRSAGLRTPIVVVAERTTGVIDAAFACGATDFSGRPLGAELVARLRRATGSSAPRAELTVGLLTIDLRRRTASLREPPGCLNDLPLTRLETDLLMLLAGRFGQEISTGELLDGAWGAKSVQPHALVGAMSRLRAKLGKSRGLIVRAKGAYRLGPKAPRL